MAVAPQREGMGASARVAVTAVVLGSALLLLAGALFVLSLFADIAPLPTAAVPEATLVRRFQDRRGDFDRMWRLAVDDARLGAVDASFTEHERPLLFGWPSASPRYRTLLERIGDDDDVSMYASKRYLIVFLAAHARSRASSETKPYPDTWREGYIFDAGGGGDGVALPNVTSLDDVTKLPPLGASRRLAGRWSVFVERGEDYA